MNGKRRPTAVLALIATIALISACGSSAPAETGSGGGNSTAANAQQAVNSPSACAATVSSSSRTRARRAKSHRWNVNGSSLDPSAPAFRQAISACKELEPAGSWAKGHSQQMDARLKFAQCMRHNGVNDFPDPTPNVPLIDTDRIPSLAGEGSSERSGAERRDAQVPRLRGGGGGGAQ